MVSGQELTSERFRTLMHGNRGSQVIQWTLVAQAISLVVFVLLASYWDFPLTEALSFPVSDGWCDVRSEGVSSHCFGDFGYQLSNAQRVDPWASGRNPYPPSVQMVFDWFRIISNVFGYNHALAMYMATLLVSTGVAVGLLVRSGTRVKVSGPTIALCVLLGWGFISALDRGNNVLWLLPMTVVAMRQGSASTRTLWWCVLGLALLKPQFMILGALLGLGRFMLLASVYVGIQALSTAWLMGVSGAFQGMRSWISSVLLYRDYPVGLGQNISLQEVFRVSATAFDGQSRTSSWLNALASLPLGIICALVFVICGLRQGKWRGRTDNVPSSELAIGVLISVMAPGVVFPYYAVVVQFVCLGVLLDRPIGREVRLSRRLLISALFTLSSATLIDPGSNRHLSVVLLPTVSLAVIIVGLLPLVRAARAPGASPANS